LKWALYIAQHEQEASILLCNVMTKVLASLAPDALGLGLPSFMKTSVSQP
jgi:hypothetical protein